MDFQNIAQALSNPHLSTKNEPPESFSGLAKSALFRNPLIYRVTLEEATASLHQVERDLSDREEKVALLTDAVESFAALAVLIGHSATNEFQTYMQKLAAETAACDRLRLTINGIHRFIAWRQENPEIKG